MLANKNLKLQGITGRQKDFKYIENIQNYILVDEVDTSNNIKVKFKYVIQKS